MKAKLILIATAIVGCGGVQADNATLEFSPEVYSALVSVCAKTHQDDRLGLYRTLKVNRIEVKTAVDQVVCNGLPLAAFARAEQAHRVAKFLAPYERRDSGSVDIKDITAAN